MNFTPKELVDEITKLYPDFVCTYNPDPVKQRIAESWPQSIDDSVARTDWGWKPDVDLKTLTHTMIEGIKIHIYEQSTPTLL